MAQKLAEVPVRQILQGNCLEVLRTLPDNSVDFCMTSPPYYGLRDYGKQTRVAWGGDTNCVHDWDIAITEKRNAVGGLGKQDTVRGSLRQSNTSSVFCSKCGAWFGQLGLEHTHIEYIEHLREIFREVKRVLKPTGSFYLNIGDCYSAKLSGNRGSSGLDRDNPSATHQDRIDTSESGITEKNLMMIPSRLAIQMQDLDGWILRNDIVWKKPNSMPQSVKDRFTTSYEHIYFFVKNSSTLLWRNRKTKKWVSEKPEQKYVEEDRVYDDYRWWCLNCNTNGTNRKQRSDHVRTTKKAGSTHITEGRLPLWQGFDYYFELDDIREPHKTVTVQRAQYNWNLDEKGKSELYVDAGLYRRSAKEMNIGFVSKINKDNRLESHFDMSKDPPLCLACGETIFKHMQGQPDGKQMELRGIAGHTTYQGKLVWYCNPSGKNPGDTIDEYTNGDGKNYYRNVRLGIARMREIGHETGSKKGDEWQYNTRGDNVPVSQNTLSQRHALARRVEGRDHDTDLNYPEGKNPSDVMDVIEYWGADKYGKYHGEAVKDYGKAGVQNASDVKRRIIEGKLRHPEQGANPSDVVDDDLSDKPSGFSYSRSGRIEHSHYAKENIDRHLVLPPRDAGSSEGSNPRDTISEGEKDKTGRVKTADSEWRAGGMRPVPEPGFGYKPNQDGKQPTDTIDSISRDTGDVLSTKEEQLRENTSWIHHGHGSKTLHMTAKKAVELGLPLYDSKSVEDTQEVSPDTRSMGAIIGERRAVKVPGGKGWTGHWEGGGNRIVRERDKRWLPEGGKTPGDYWEITTQPFKEAHFAVYPESLCAKPIKASCIPDGVVLDPFAGSGTTLVVAERLGRKWVGIEINPEYVKMAQKRLEPYLRQKFSEEKSDIPEDF